MYCSKCGSQNNENVKFCANCGNDLTNQVNNNSNDVSDSTTSDSNSIKTELETNNNVQQEVINNNQVNLNKEIDSSTNNSNTIKNRTPKNNSNLIDSLKKLDKKIYIIGGIVVAVILLIVLIMFIFNGNKDKIESVDDINKTSSFFIKNDEGKYALFNDEGKKLTDFEFTEVNSFINGATIVENEIDEVGIINDEGKMVVAFGKYKSIYAKSGLYKVTDEEYNSYLLDSNGKQLEKMNDKDLITYLGESTYSILQTQNEYKVLNYKGDVLVSFKRVENEKDEPKTSSEDEYVSIFYNNKNYIVDVIKNKKVIDFESQKHFCVKEINENDNSQIILNSCVSWLESQDTIDYRLIDNGKLLYEKNKEECSNLYFDGKLVMCNSSDGKYILDKKGNKSENIQSYAYIDDENYAKQTDGSFNGVDFYVKGELKKHIDCLSLSDKEYVETEIYKLGTYYSSKCGTTSGTYQLFKKDGSLLTDTKYRSIGDFDDNNLSIVTEDREKYYLINTAGEKISSDYDKIRTTTSNYYIATNSDDVQILLDSKGKELVRGLSISVTKFDDKYYATIKNSDTEYVVYNVSKAKQIVTVSSNPKIYENYFTVIKDGKTQYYSYNNGKMFYEI